VGLTLELYRGQRAAEEKPLSAGLSDNQGVAQTLLKQRHWCEKEYE